MQSTYNLYDTRFVFSVFLSWWNVINAIDAILVFTMMWEQYPQMRGQWPAVAVAVVAVGGGVAQGSAWSPVRARCTRPPLRGQQPAWLGPRNEWKCWRKWTFWRGLQFMVQGGWVSALQYCYVMMLSHLQALTDKSKLCELVVFSRPLKVWKT